MLLGRYHQAPWRRGARRGQRCKHIALAKRNIRERLLLSGRDIVKNNCRNNEHQVFDLSAPAARKRKLLFARNVGGSAERVKA